MYRKREGTSGISGHLYETKLISLILFRLLHNDKIDDFHMASNMDDIGAFDDVCIKIKMKGDNTHKLVFIQAKHRENDESNLKFDNKSDLMKWSESINKIKENFSKDSKDVFFRGKYEDVECYFILYTNAKFDSNKNNEFKSSFSADLNELIGTAATNAGSRAIFTTDNYRDFGKALLKEDLSVLAKSFAKFLNNKSNQMFIMNDEYIQRYHVILAKKILYISKVQFEVKKPDNKWRTLTFRNRFFKTEDEYLALFRNYLCEQIIRNQMDAVKKKKIDAAVVEELISKFLSEPTVITLKPLFGTHITFNNSGKLEFATVRPDDDLQKLQIINNSSFIIDEAKKILMKLRLKVPITFGNVDLAIKGDKNINILSNLIIELCKKPEHIQSKIIVIDDTSDKIILRANGGLGSGLGNILAFDETTGLLKIANIYTSQKSNAKTIFNKLKEEISDLHKYRFDINTTKFPKLNFDSSNVARDFFSKLIIFGNQSDHNKVEELLKNGIKTEQIVNHQNMLNHEAIYTCYHYTIQDWWMSSKGEYLTKKSIDIYHQAIKNIVKEPKITALQNMFYNSKVKDVVYTFNDNVTERLELLEDSKRLVIVTDITTLATMKVVQSMRNSKNNKQFAILDFEFILNLPDKDFVEFASELKATEKVLIIVCVNTKNTRTFHKRLDKLVEDTENKHIIVITNNEHIEVAEDYFKPGDNIIYSDKLSLNDLTPESQDDIIKNVQVIFQGEELGLGEILDNISVTFIKGVVLDKIIRDKTITIGQPLNTSNYEEIKHLYADRRISQEQTIEDLFYVDFVDYNSDNETKEKSRGRLVTTFNDIKDEVVLITAKPGMGKSTLLTHLSLETKKENQKLWIVRVNLVDHSKQFYQWQSDSTIINTLEALKFICKVILQNYNISIRLNESASRIYLEDCAGDDWAVFELNMFLHFYNNCNLLLLFDGFDEICPHYKDIVIDFLNAVKKSPQKNKMCVTSRPYSEILPDLETVLGKSYELEYIDDIEQEKYFEKYWRNKLIFEKLNEVQLGNVKSFLNFMSELNLEAIDYPESPIQLKLLGIYNHLYKYIQENFTKDMDLSININKCHEIHKFNSKVDKTIPTEHVKVDTFIGTPLFLHLLADYFINLILINDANVKWELDINIYNIYEMFIETKLKKILYEEKVKIDVYNPKIITIYEKERADCVAMHKKLAAFALLGAPICNGICEEEFQDMQPFYDDHEFNDMINKIKNGNEKTGLISYITPDYIPVFIHRTFAEYFATEFLCDIFKDKYIKFENKKLLHIALQECNFTGVCNWLSEKRLIDKELDFIIKDIENNQPFSAKYWYGQIFSCGSFSTEQMVRLLNSTPEDYDDGLLVQCYNEYKYDSKEIINKLGAAEFAYIIKILDDVIENMKPHLRDKMPQPLDYQPAVYFEP